MHFGKVSRFILLGAGIELIEFASIIKRHGIDVRVFTSKRHLDEKMDDNKTFKQLLKENNINYLESKDVNMDQTAIEYLGDGTVGVSFGAAWIFKKEFIDRFGGRLLNLHATRLPQNRGGGGFSWQILTDNRLGYSVLHQVDPSLDTGDIIMQNEFYYPKTCRIPKDYGELCTDKIIELLDDFLKRVIREEEFHPMKQQEQFSTYWPRLHTKTHGYIDWSLNVNFIERFICAFDDPYDGASTLLYDKRVFLKRVFTDYNDGSFHPFQSGIVYRKRVSSLFVAAIGGSLIINKVLDADGTDIMAQVKLGDRLYTPQEYLDKSRSFRAIYNPNGLR